MIVNKLRWVSSILPQNEGALRLLNEKLIDFYSLKENRGVYQNVIDRTHSEENNTVSKIAYEVAEIIVSTDNILNFAEFGCGSGKLYHRLKEKGYKGHYTGFEMAEYVINENKTLLPDADWKVGSVYDDGIPNESFDGIVMLFVLEHLVYPEKALLNFLRILKPGGRIYLVFPDMIQSEIFTSQKLGLNGLGGVKAKLLKGKLIDSFVTFLESYELRRNLIKTNKKFGSFVINIDPICFDRRVKSAFIPDMDAIYISSAKEIEKWFCDKSCKVDFPLGTEGKYLHNVFIKITK